MNITDDDREETDAGIRYALALLLGLAYSSLSSIGSLGQELDTQMNKTAKTMELAGAIATQPSR